MNSFVQKHQALVMGVLSGFDRLVFRGNVRPVAYADGMKRFLDNSDVLLKDFGRYAEATTTRVKEASLALAKDAGRPVHYLLSPKEPKEELARAIAKKDGIKEGLVCVLTTNELTRCFDIHRNREAKKLELRMRPRRCLHLYHYYLHPLFGFMHIRLQSWLPFPIQIWVNGREWLARTLERKNIDYLRRDNCLPWIADVERAQHLMDRLLTTNWRRTLDGMRMQAHPAHEQIFPSTTTGRSTRVNGPPTSCFAIDGRSCICTTVSSIKASRASTVAMFYGSSARGCRPTAAFTANFLAK